METGNLTIAAQYIAAALIHPDEGHRAAYALQAAEIYTKAANLSGSQMIAAFSRAATKLIKPPQETQTSPEPTLEAIAIQAKAHLARLIEKANSLNELLLKKCETYTSLIDRFGVQEAPTDRISQLSRYLLSLQHEIGQIAEMAVYTSSELLPLVHEEITTRVISNLKFYETIKAKLA